MLLALDEVFGREPFIFKKPALTAGSPLAAQASLAKAAKDLGKKENLKIQCPSTFVL
jgi:hypothetical protein